MSPTNRTASPSPGSRSASHHTPNKARPVLAGLLVLAVGVPAVWLLSEYGPGRPVPGHGPVSTTSPVAAATAGPTELVVVPPSAAPAGAVVAHRHRTARPHPRRSATAAPRPSATSAPGTLTTRWIMAQCARRYPDDAYRRHLCQTALTHLTSTD